MRTYHQREDSVILSRGKEEFRPEPKAGDIMLRGGERFRLELKAGRRCEDCPFYDSAKTWNWQCGLPRDVRNNWCTAYPPEAATIFVALDTTLPGMED